MSRDEILSRLRSEYMGRSLYYYEETDSTNLRIRQLADEGADEGTLAVSDMQTAGRGRRGRGWISPPGMNIYMSLLLKPDIAPSDAPMITIIMAMAVCDAVCDMVGGAGVVPGADRETPDVRIKWPNDIVVNGRKVCGILTEMDMAGDRIDRVTVGVGINVNQSDRDLFPQDIRETATSLKLECGADVNRAVLIARIMEEFERLYVRFVQKRNLGFMHDRYEERLAGLGNEVRVLDPQGEYTGVSRGITDRGELLVETADGTVQTVYAGEVSVRGLYGYT